MALNHHFWDNACRRDFAPQLRAVVDVLSRRLIPAFDFISEESDAVADQTWEALMSAPGSEYVDDPSEYADAARDAGMYHYLMLSGIRQGMLNLFATALFHTFEQQVMFFLRREILHKAEEFDDKLFSWKVFGERLGRWGIEYKQLPSWPTVREAELVANTVKHGDGRSASELFALHPTLFHHHGSTPQSTGPDKPRIDRPLLGEGVFITFEDIERYRDALIGFWTELMEEIGRVP